MKTPKMHKSCKNGTSYVMPLEMICNYFYTEMYFLVFVSILEYYWILVAITCISFVVCFGILVAFLSILPSIFCIVGTIWYSLASWSIFELWLLLVLLSCLLLPHTCILIGQRLLLIRKPSNTPRNVKHTKKTAETIRNNKKYNNTKRTKRY